jgi:sugar-phosphatase
LELPMTATAVLTARALLLDMDGTLVNSDASAERVWRRWSEQHGLDADEVMKVVHGRQGLGAAAG